MSNCSGYYQHYFQHKQSSKLQTMQLKKFEVRKLVRRNFYEIRKPSYKLLYRSFLFNMNSCIITSNINIHYTSIMTGFTALETF